MGKMRTVIENWDRSSFWRDAVLPNLRNKYVLSKLYSRVIHGKASSVPAEDWDNLIILDACRFDAFAEINWLDGKLESRISKGSVTGEYLNKNFDEVYPDTVLFAGNPHASRLMSDKFNRINHVWRDDWDEELQTVPPDQMVDTILGNRDIYNDKRMIAHFVQPHTPYIGQEALERYGDVDGLRVPREMAERSASSSSEFEWTSELHLFEAGKVDRDDILTDYKENLRIVLDQVERLVTELDGKTVITADHGEMFGEFAFPYPVRRVGHINGLRTTALVKVPWFILPVEERREIENGEVHDASNVSSEKVSDRLRSLGYLRDT